MEILFIPSSIPFFVVVTTQLCFVGQQSKVGNFALLVSRTQLNDAAVGKTAHVRTTGIEWQLACHSAADAHAGKVQRACMLHLNGALHAGILFLVRQRSACCGDTTFA
jgi:hypothetical protein